MTATQNRFSLVSFILFQLWFCFNFSTSHAGKVEKLKIYSTTMNKQISVLVIAPEQVSKPLPVIYLLHGYDGNSKTWFSIKPELTNIATTKQMLFVCPDAANSWYWDSPIKTSSRYETFIAKELIQYIDKHYPTIKNKNGRAITGLSMGGHGAMWLAIRNTNTFGAAGSMSGGLDILPFPNNWGIKLLLGVQEHNKKQWEQHSVMNLIDVPEIRKLALIIDCGTDDFFVQVNKDFHAQLLKKKIEHVFILRPGQHDRIYWQNAIDFQLLFFEKFFKNNINNSPSTN